MREIKFRAWHNEGKMFIDWDTIKNQHSMYFIFEYGDIALQQYTGLKDKNGVEIYESDIVLIHDDGEPNGVYTVEWCSDVGYPAFDLKPHIDCDCNAMSYYGNDDNYMLVIGNIHQNPELLAVQNGN